MHLACCLAMFIAVVVMPPTPSMKPFTPEESKSTDGHATTTVRSDVAWVGSSQTFHIIVTIKPEEGWHVYWKNPGASGAPTEIEVMTPEGFHVGEARFPRPSTYFGEEGLTYGYSEEAAIFIPVTAPKSLQEGEASFEVTTIWLACKEKCVIGQQTHPLTLSLNPTIEGPKHRDMRLKQWESKLPKPINELMHGNAAVVGNTLQVVGSSNESHIQFIGVEQKDIWFGPQMELVRSGEQFRIPIPIFPDFRASQGEPITIEGILLVGRKNSDPSYVVRVVLESDTQQ